MSKRDSLNRIAPRSGVCAVNIVFMQKGIRLAIAVLLVATTGSFVCFFFQCSGEVLCCGCKFVCFTCSHSAEFPERRTQLQSAFRSMDVALWAHYLWVCSHVLLPLVVDRYYRMCLLLKCCEILQFFLSDHLCCGGP